MSVVRRENSRFWYVQFQMNGTTYIRSSRTTSKKIAEQIETNWKAQIHAQQFLGKRERITIRKAVEQYCDSKRGTAFHPALLSHLKALCRLVPVSKPFTDLSLHDLERFKRAREAEAIGHQTLKHTFNLVRGAWKYAKKAGFDVGDLQFPDLQIPKPTVRYITEAEEARLLHELDPTRNRPGMKPYGQRSPQLQARLQDNFDLSVLLLDTGARCGEISNLEQSRIDLVRREIHLYRPKVSNEGVLMMTDRVHMMLERRLRERPGQWLFTNKKGRKRGYSVRAIKAAFERAGIVATVHFFRHTFASRLLRHGLELREIQELLGHADIRSTARYSHLQGRAAATKARDVMNRLNGDRT